ncbi:TPA: fimbrial protein [Citrobacter koseri]
MLSAKAFAINEQDNVHFSGTLVADPCVIPPGEEEIVLDFGSVINKDLYVNGRTVGQPFSLHLTECDPAISETVFVRFLGTESSVLPGRLALDPGSTASGVAIGLESEDGVIIDLGEATAATAIQAGDMHLKYMAYVEAEPDAIAGTAIMMGVFSATATFSLEYE